LSLIRDLYSRFREIGAEGIRFCIVGGAGAVVGIGLQDVLYLAAGVGALTANTLGVVAGIILTFPGNRYWTYAHKRSHGKEFVRETWQFFLWACVGWAIQDGLVAVGTYGLHWTNGFAYTLVTCFGIGVATIFRFWAYRTLVFTGESPAPVAEPAEDRESEPAP
jgi:putative flippase GtrA